MRSIIALFLVIPSLACAHVETGTFSGKDQNGDACQFEVGEQWFENNKPHPLNERIPVSKIQFKGGEVAQVIWNLGHPPVVNAEAGQARFNHDLFQEVVASDSGGIAVILLKNPKEDAKGHKPLGLIYIDDSYKDAAKSKKLTCTL